MKNLSLGYSPCPNDTFIFYALTHAKVDTKNLQFIEQLLDVETLNRKALRTELDLTKVSWHAFAHLRKNYIALRAGGAMGRGCGPLVIAKKECSIKDLRDKKIAIPGRLTTAHLLLQLHDPAFVSTDKSSNIYEMPFHKIIEAVVNDEVDAGLIIHESRFTYSSFGLKQVIDLGQWWEVETGLPIPLGCIIAKQSLGSGLHQKVNTIIKQSTEYALNNRSNPMEYIKKHSQELSDDVIKSHIELYVNDFSIDVGNEGEKAVTELFSRAEKNGIFPESKDNIFA